MSMVETVCWVNFVYVLCCLNLSWYKWHYFIFLWSYFILFLSNFLV